MAPRQQSRSPGHSWIVWAISLGILSLVSLNGLSQLTETSEPEHPPSINPLNTEARVAWLIKALNAGEGAPSSETLLEETKTGLRISPLDARLHSLAGELLLRAGGEAEAYRLFRQANRISHTEVHALQYLIARAIEAGEYTEALDQIDVLLRRWPHRADFVLPVLPQLLADEDAYDAVLAAMTSDAPWRGRLLVGLSRDPVGLSFGYRILLDLANTPYAGGPAEVAAVVRGFMAAKRFEEAYRLFRFTIPPEERPLEGFIYNSEFRPSSLSTLPFSWQRRNTRAAEIRFPEDGEQTGATVRFLSAPAKGLVLNQSLVLPRGQYRLVSEVDASGLKAPRTLYWRIRCQSDGRELLRLQIPEGSYQKQRLEATFEVPDCPLQRIELGTDVIAESWQNRYSGQVRFHFVRIERTDLAGIEN